MGFRVHDLGVRGGIWGYIGTYKDIGIYKDLRGMGKKMEIIVSFGA